MSLEASPMPASAGRDWDSDQPAQSSHRDQAFYQGLGRVFENRWDVWCQSYLPPRLLAGRIVKAQTLFDDGRILLEELEETHAEALAEADRLSCRKRVQACVRELHWLQAQSGACHASEFREAARLFGT